MRDRNNGTGGNLGINGSGLGERLYALQDANWNVVALGQHQRRGARAVLVHGLWDGDGLEPRFLGRTRGSTNFHWTTLFAARDVDTATGLYYNNARWYNPSLGVFVTTDPVAADPNTYRYAGNNPVTATDPSGMYIGPHLAWDDDPVTWPPPGSKRSRRCSSRPFQIYHG